MSHTHPKVLVIDDDQGILDALKFMLENSGYAVECIARGDEVLAALNAFMPDVILLDLYLSGYDGRDIALDIKKEASGKEVPIVMISAHPSAGEVLKDSPIAEFLPKPFDVTELLTVIEKHSAVRNL